VARKTYTREFKLAAVRMITDQGLSFAETARKLGVSENCLPVWHKAANELGADAFPGHGNATPADDEVHRLPEQVRRLQAERDLLKKAAAYFASHPS